MGRFYFFVVSSLNSQEQRELLRTTLKEMWIEDGNNGEEFKKWWTFVTDDIRTAMIYTALEEVMNTISVSSMLTIVTPELEMEPLCLNKGQKVVDLLQLLADDKENEEDVFSFRQFLQAFESEKMTLITTAIKSLKLLRTCALLEFSVSVLLIWNNQKEETQFI